MRVADPGVTVEVYERSADDTVFGRVEVLTCERVAGWVLVKGHDDPIVLRLEMSGQTIGEVVCTNRRQDITAIIGHDGALGFDVPLTFNFPTGYVELMEHLVVTHSESASALSAKFANTMEYSDRKGEKRRLESYSGNSDLKFSFVIPVYDRVQELRESINSCLNQNYDNFEVILVGDNPPENTLAVLEAYRTNPRIRTFIFKDRSGNACRGRNKGISIATGDIIAFQDSDDVAFPDRLSTAAYVFKNVCNGGVDMVYSSVSALTDGSRSIDGISFGHTINSQILPFDRLLRENPVFTCTACVRRDLLLLRGGFRREMIYREDHELWLRLAHGGAVFHVIPESQSLYRIHSGNAELSFVDRDHIWKARMLDVYSQEWDAEWVF